MQGSAKVIGALNHLLVGELAARDQYFIHSRMYEDWGYGKLFERIEHEMQEETEHAAWLIRRILFLGGTPAMVPSALNIGSDVPSMMKSDLELEYQVVRNVRAAMGTCEQEHDYVSRDILLKMLDDTEMDHARWLEQQLRHIDQMGLENYLQSKI